MPDACCTAERPHTEPIATLPPGITHYVTTGSPFTGADQAVQDEDPWRCTVCGSTQPVRARAGRATEHPSWLSASRTGTGTSHRRHGAASHERPRDGARGPRLG